jgi:hypothetical protein
MFDVTSHIVKVADQKEKALGQADLKFSVKTLKYMFGDNMKSEEFVDRIKIILKDLTESGVLLKQGEHILIDETEFSKYYVST